MSAIPAGNSIHWSVRSQEHPPISSAAKAVCLDAIQQARESGSPERFTPPAPHPRFSPLQKRTAGPATGDTIFYVCYFCHDRYYRPLEIPCQVSVPCGRPTGCKGVRRSKKKGGRVGHSVRVANRCGHGLRIGFGEMALEQDRVIMTR